MRSDYADDELCALRNEQRAGSCLTADSCKLRACVGSGYVTLACAILSHGVVMLEKSVQLLARLNFDLRRDDCRNALEILW